MPKGFSEREKAYIRAMLLEKGKEAFATYGVKRSNVEDLTRAVGISKGAFYQFYASKEELFFELLMQFEDAYHTTLLEIVAQPGESSRQQVQTFFQHAFTQWRTNPLFTHFNQEDYAYLVRKLPPERVQTNLNADARFVERLLAQWREQGIVIDCEPAIFLGLMRSLFFVSLHEGDFEQGTYPTLIDFIIDMVVQRIVVR